MSFLEQLKFTVGLSDFFFKFPCFSVASSCFKLQILLVTRLKSGGPISHSLLSSALDHEKEKRIKCHA